MAFRTPRVSSEADLSTAPLVLPRLSVIIPVLNEAENLPRLLQDLAVPLGPECEIIVVDGGSVDGTRELARLGADRVLLCAPGRALQMNAGAAVAQGAVLWFLHADTRVPVELPGLLRQSFLEGCSWGRCRVRLSGDRVMFRIIESMMNLRSCITGIATGDQGICVSRDAFRAVGGFPAIPLMEDIALSRALGRSFGRPVCLTGCIVTSSRRWEEGGVLRTVLMMWRLRLSYWLGTDPAQLARRYR